MKRNKFLCILIAAVFFMASCDLLDRPNPQVTSDDPEFWRTETNIRAFAQEFYTNFFVGFNTGFGEVMTPIRGLLFCDNVVASGMPRPFPTAAPANLGGTGSGLTWWFDGDASRHGLGPFWAGTNWNFYWIRKANLMINRIETYSRGHISEAAYNHWRAKAHFFKALEYSRMVGTFGDVPWFERQIDLTDRAELFRDRDPRNFVMDRVYRDFRNVLTYIRPRSATHAQEVNRDVAAAFISRWMLFEGTWQWYHYGNADRAAKFLNFAVEASEYLMNSNRYSINRPLRDLFSTTDGNVAAAGNEVILWRTYRRAITMHAISTYNNFMGISNPYTGANLSLINAFITTDGALWQNTPGAEDFSLDNLLRTRDPRFEASFVRRLCFERSPTAIFYSRFIRRSAIDLAVANFDDPENNPGLMPEDNFPDYTRSTNTTSFPIIRLGEILLNWIEARAVLAYMGRGPAVTPDDINRSINVLRQRPIDQQARDLFDLDYTAPMDIDNLPDDPRRHVEGVTSALIWEIRRERQMELFQEFPRMLDLRRWNRLANLDTAANPKIVLSTWVDFNAPNMSHLLSTAAAANGTIQVRRFEADGVTLTPPIIFNGTNHADMVGFRVMNVHPTTGALLNRTGVQPRLNLAPIGQNQINLYRENNFTLTQTRYW